MKLHTNLATYQVREALTRAKAREDVSPYVSFSKLDAVGSRTHHHGFEIHLVAWEKMPGEKRRRPNQNSEAFRDGYWAATYDEWGWFIAELFAADHGAKFGHYENEAGFHQYTKGEFRLGVMA